jgi:NitT/TauT family transport system substrate-binding protein
MKSKSFLLVLILLGTTAGFGQQVTIRVGAFPNITHPQATIGKANGSFDKAMSACQD